jgi:hypothetical protein
VNVLPDESTTRLIDPDLSRDVDILDCAPTHDRYAELAMSRDVVVDDWMHGRLPTDGGRHG